jgi:hypothetical protein
MDDGGKSRNGVVFYTNCFSPQDLDLLQNALSSRFGLQTTRQKSKPGAKLYLSPKQIPLFSHLVKPFLVPSMEYKLPLQKKNRNIKNNQIPHGFFIRYKHTRVLTCFFNIY